VLLVSHFESFLKTIAEDYIDALAGARLESRHIPRGVRPWAVEVTASSTAKIRPHALTSTACGPALAERSGWVKYRCQPPRAVRTLAGALPLDGQGGGTEASDGPPKDAATLTDEASARAATL
jgi:hypothetical protein